MSDKIVKQPAISTHYTFNNRCRATIQFTMHICWWLENKISWTVWFKKQL